jgi:ribose 5-phosphate isomerase A
VILRSPVENQRIAWKRAAAEHATHWLRSDMVVGLGSGTTASFAVYCLSALLARRQLTGVTAVPCSNATRRLAVTLGIPLTTLEEHPHVDVTIDGADEVDPSLAMIKGRGGALLREKIVGQASLREIIVVDATKVSRRLGTNCALPVEVSPFGWRSQAQYIEALGARVRVRLAPGGEPFRTDQDNLILDCDFGPLHDPRTLAGELSERAGILEHGLFLALATDLVIAGDTGIRHLTRPS